MAHSNSLRVLTVVVAAITVFASGETVIRSMLRRDGRVRHALSDQERRDFDWHFSSREGASTGVALVGTSLAGGTRTSLAHELNELSAGKLRVVDDSHPGLIGDVIARVLVNHSRGLPSVAELNVFPINEREYLFADWRQYSILARPEHALPVLRLPSQSVRSDVLRHDGFDAVAGSGLRQLLAGYHLGRSVQGGAKERLRIHLLGKATPPNRPTEQQRLAIEARNFRRKSFRGGPDTRVLDALVAWTAEVRPRSRLVVYFPPLNERQIRSVTGQGHPFWSEFRAWRAELARRLEANGVAVLDYTDFFANEPDVFLDYGHMKDSAFPRLATALEHSLVTRTLAD